MKDIKIHTDKIVLIGDTIVDINTEGALLGTSSETPTLVISKELDRTTLGGAALVHRNLQKLKCQHQFITGVNGVDSLIKDMLLMNASLVYTHKKTIIIQRFWCQHHKLLQVDTIDNSPIQKKESQKVEALIDKLQPDLLVVSDYRHGFLSDDLINFINMSNIPLILDSQVSKRPANHHHYKHIYLALLNEHEALQYVPSVSWDNPKEWKDQLFENIDSHSFIIKFGKKGCIYLNKDQPREDMHILANSVENPVDTAGAGAAFLAGLLSRWNTSKIHKAIHFATNWATKSVMVKGANPPNE